MQGGYAAISTITHYLTASAAMQTDPEQLGLTHVPSALLPPTWRIMAKSGELTLPLDTGNMHQFLSAVHNEEARKQVHPILY